MTHFLALIIFSALVAVVFAALSSEHHDTSERIKYGVKVFGSFVLIGLAIAWALYPLPI
jgi:L-cystine uptake protein TcyP (sodium:dicarboxylate symporter family)